MSTFDAMRALASERGWTLDPANPGALHLYSAVSVCGVESGIPIRLERVAGAETFTTIAHLEPPLSPGFVITHEGFAAVLANLIGIHDIEVGDPAFDKDFRIRSNDPAAVKRLLTPGVRSALRQLSDNVKPLGLRSFHVSESGVSITRQTSVALGTNPGTTEELLRDVPLVLAVVRAFRGADAS